MKEVKILIIDDDIQDLKALSLALSKQGYSQVSTAQTAEEGIKLIKTLKPGIVLVDVVLNGIDGFDLCKQIEAAEEIRPKIIMVTGHLDAIDARKARASGADEIIEKTPDFGNLIHLIKNLT